MLVPYGVVSVRLMCLLGGSSAGLAEDRLEQSTGVAVDLETAGTIASRILCGLALLALRIGQSNDDCFNVNGAPHQIGWSCRPFCKVISTEEHITR